jgi:hypothetical protein
MIIRGNIWDRYVFEPDHCTANMVCDDFMVSRLQGAMVGKQQHMGVAAEKTHNDTKALITRKSTLLIDDTMSHIQVALENSVRAVIFHTDAEERYTQSMFSFTRVLLLTRCIFHRTIQELITLV